VSVAGFIATQRAQYQIPHATACRAFGVSQAWFYKWQHGDASPRHARRAQLTAAIRQLFAQHQGRYGSPRITADLRALGWRVSVNTVAKIMAEQGLVSRPKRRRKSTTRPGRGRWRAPDLVKRQFSADQVNRKWFGDGTEIVTDEGKLHLDTVLDVRSRRILGFGMSEQLRGGLRPALIPAPGGTNGQVSERRTNKTQEPLRGVSTVRGDCHTRAVDRYRKRGRRGGVDRRPRRTRAPDGGPSRCPY
jgi:hypothetical protein